MFFDLNATQHKYFFIIAIAVCSLSLTLLMFNLFVKVQALSLPSNVGLLLTTVSLFCTSFVQLGSWRKKASSN